MGLFWNNLTFLQWPDGVQVDHKTVRGLFKNEQRPAIAKVYRSKCNKYTSATQNPVCHWNICHKYL